VSLALRLIYLHRDRHTTSKGPLACRLAFDLIQRPPTKAASIHQNARDDCYQLVQTLPL
jgi:hypothetical protein